VLCLIILIYQFIDITNIYLNFAHEVKFNVEDFKGLNLLSIFFTSKENIFGTKQVIKVWEKILTHILLIFSAYSDLKNMIAFFKPFFKAFTYNSIQSSHK
jgi:hypothetical protein